MHKAAVLLTVLALIVAGVAVGWRFFEKERVIAEQRRVIAELETRIERAWAEELVGDVKVESVSRDPETGERQMELVFVQYAPGTEMPVLRRRFTLPGEEFFVDALVVRFERSFVEVGDGLRGQSLLLFRRAFGDRQRPVDGVSLYRGEDDGLGIIPELFRIDPVPSDFERDIWERFWEMAADPAAARAEGVEIAQGEAPYTRAVQGQVYQLTLRASGGLEIRPRLPRAVVGDEEVTAH
ncbi:MAG: hypothetical protein ACOCVR_04635 [Myxococcota bacterium]